MSSRSIALALSPEDWARVCAGLDLLAANEAAAIRVFEVVRARAGLADEAAEGGSLSSGGSVAS